MARRSVAPNIAYDEEKNRYYVTLYCGADAGGGRVKHTRCVQTLEQAALVRDNFYFSRAISRRTLPEGTTVSLWLDYWLNEVVRPVRAATTIYGYQKIIENHLKPLLGSIPLEALSAPQIQQYMARKQKEGLSPNTIRKHHVLLNSAVSLAVRQELLSRNVVRSVTPPPYREPRHLFYSPQQLASLFALSAGTALEPVVKLAGYLGLRRSEICGLKWSSVDLEHSVLYVCEARTAANGIPVDKGPKSPSSVRRLSFAGVADLQQLLGRLRRRDMERRALFGGNYNPQVFVLTHGRGAPYAPDYLSGCFTRFIRAHRLPPCTLHGLRHSFASIANSQHVSLLSICKALGHSSTAITSQVYTHLFDDTHREVVELVGQAIREGQSGDGLLLFGGGRANASAEPKRQE